MTFVFLATMKKSRTEKKIRSKISFILNEGSIIILNLYFKNILVVYLYSKKSF